MMQKKWFQTLTAFILTFLLILLISKVSFIFNPMFKYVGAVAVPIVGAGVLYYLTKPVMYFFMRFKIHRIISIIFVFLLLTTLGFLFITYIFPIAQTQFNNLMNNIPKMVRITQVFIDSVQSDQIIIPDQVYDAIDDFMNNIQSYIESTLTYLVGFIGHIISFVASLVLIPFFLFFMLKDGEKLVPFITQIFKKEKAENIQRLLARIDETLTAFIQGQLIVSFFVGILLFIAYIILGLEYSLTLALFAMLMNVIPFIGPFLAVIPALIVAAFDESSMMIVWVAIVTLIAQQTESQFISPNVMGRVLDLHPLTVITVILAAGSIAGFIGILFAVPFYAVIKTIVIHFYKTYEESKEKKEDALI